MAQEVHEHFDAEGNLTGTTVVTRESLWDDASRARAIRLFEYERGTDPETGLPKSVAFDKSQPFIVHNDVINYAAKAKAKTRAADAEAHKDHPDWFDGRHYVVQPYEAPTPD